MAAEVGQKAPAFTLVNTDLKATSLSDFSGKNVLLAQIIENWRRGNATFGYRSYPTPFCVVSCIESEDSIVSLAMAAVSFQADSDVTNVLFWEWQDTSVQTWKGEDSLLLNTALYARHRDMIQQRLDDNARRAIADFEI